MRKILTLKISLLFISFILLGFQSVGQTAKMSGTVKDRQGKVIPSATISIPHLTIGGTTDRKGRYVIESVPFGEHTLKITAIGFKPETIKITLKKDILQDIQLMYSNDFLDELVVTGTMKPVKKSESPIPIKTFTSAFFQKNASPDLFDALQNINGVRPQLNCNVCNTGDIHINGLEGPYTMVLIDGMPIMSTLGTVYGFSGIPSALIKRLEVVKGPASSLYGSQAMGGLINVITKNPQNTPFLQTDISTTSWGAYNADLAISTKVGEKTTALTGINYYNFQNKIDKDGDGFTDKTLQHRIALFQKWNFDRKKNRKFTLAGRYYYEDRWGGDIHWNSKHRGDDKVYGESIYTNRVAFLGNYQLPTSEHMFFRFSLTNHDQDSRYGNESYIANQKIAYGQWTWNKMLGDHDILVGTALKYAYYDDNTPATAKPNGDNEPEHTWLPGIFLQDDILLKKNHHLLLGIRYDHNNIHGRIFTPRLAYKWSITELDILRLNMGSGYRVVHVFSEDHAALTGGKEVIIQKDLKPEQSYNLNLNFEKHIYTPSGNHIGLDGSVFYTYFTNKIIPDYESDPTAIIYQNIHDGNSISKGISLDIDLNFNNGLNIMLGGTILDNTIKKEHIKTREMKSERFTGTWTISYPIHTLNLAIDYTGQVVSPMRLPLQGNLDPRSKTSPWFSIQNIQFTYSGFKKFELYAGIKNLFDWTVGKATKPFLIARPQDPFDNNVTFDSQDQPIKTPNNPYALIFDPDSYSYGSNVGIRGILGVRFTLK